MVEAGCILKTAKQAADAQNCLLPITFGAQGSARVGGNVAGSSSTRWIVGAAGGMVTLEGAEAPGQRPAGVFPEQPGREAAVPLQHGDERCDTNLR